MAARRALLARHLPPGVLAAANQLPLLSCIAAELRLSSGSVHTASNTAAPCSSGSCDTSTGSAGSSCYSAGSSCYSGSWAGRGWQLSQSSSGCALSLAAWRGYSSAAAAGATAAAGAAAPAEPSAPPALDELPLWRYLRQQGFSAESISRMQQATAVHKNAGGRRYPRVTGMQMNEEKLQGDLAPNIAALRAEGLDTASLEQLFEQRPGLLTATRATFSSALAALRRLAALLPDDPRTVHAPLGATQLGVALWRYPTLAAALLPRPNLGSLVERNLQLRRLLGISDAATALALFQRAAALVSKFERAEAMVAHLQRLQATGTLSEEQVSKLALSGALVLTPAEFDRRRQEGGASPLISIRCKKTAERQQASADALGELLQAAGGAPGPLQPHYRQQAEVLVQRQPGLWASGPAALRASWASLQRLGLSSSQVVAAVQLQPAVLTCNWEGEAKQRLLAWVQQELGLSPFDFLTRHAGYASYSVARLAMRADFLRQHRPAVWQAKLARGAGPLLSLLTHTCFFDHASCTRSELAAFNRAWLTTPAGRRWGGKPVRQHSKLISSPTVAASVQHL